MKTSETGRKMLLIKGLDIAGVTGMIQHYANALHIRSMLIGIGISDKIASLIALHWEHTGFYHALYTKKGKLHHV